jgi:hypothetical protein
VARPDRVAELLGRLAGLPAARIGAFDATGRLRVEVGGAAVIDDDVAALARAWKREGVQP